MTSFHLNHFHEDPISKHSHFLMSWGLGLQHMNLRDITEPITTLKPKKKNVNPLAYIFLLLFAVYTVYSLISLQTSIEAKEKEAAMLQASIESQEIYNSSVQDLLNAENDDAYVADIARDMLGYVMPGDKVFVDISSK